MTKRLLTALAFAVLVAVGGVAAAVVADNAPSSVQQTVSTSTTGSTTGSTTTATTATTTTVATTTTTTTTTTKPRKITICHHVFGARTTKHVTIRINRSAWPAHQRHGDSIGACNTASAKKFHSRKAHIKRFHHGRHG